MGVQYFSPQNNEPFITLLHTSYSLSYAKKDDKIIGRYHFFNYIFVHLFDLSTKLNISTTPNDILLCQIDVDKARYFESPYIYVSTTVSSIFEESLNAHHSLGTVCLAQKLDSAEFQFHYHSNLTLVYFA